MCSYCSRCGPQDYEIALKYNLEIYSPLQEDGRYSATIELAELINKSNT